MLRQPLLFVYWLPKHPVFWFTTLFSIQLVRPPLVTYSSLCSTCVIYGTSCHARCHRHFPPIVYHECYRYERSFFTLRCFFTLNSFLLFLRSPWDWQFTLKGSRALSWSSKHSSGPTIVLNHRNPQKSILVRLFTCLRPLWK